MTTTATRRRRESATLRRTIDSLRSEVMALERRRDGLLADIARYRAAIQSTDDLVALANKHGLEIPRELREIPFPF